MKLTMVGWLLLHSSMLIAQKTTLEVSKDGISHITNAEQTFVTIQQAIDYIPVLKSEKPLNEIEIVINEGTYFLLKALRITNQHAGDSLTKLTIRGIGEVIVSGGKKLDFTSGADGMAYSTLNGDLPITSGLYVNQERKTLARTPNKGFFELLGIREEFVEADHNKFKESVLYLKLDEQIATSLRQLSPEELSYVQIHFIHIWDLTIKVLDRYDAETGEFITKPSRMMKPHNPLQVGSRYFVRGYSDAGDAPGEWFKEGNQLFYLHGGETIKEAIVPMLRELLIIVGTRKHQVSNVSIENIKFRHSKNVLASYGWIPQQAAASVPAAIKVRFAKNISFHECAFEKMGQYAMWLESGVINSSVTKCFLNDLGAGGIKIGLATQKILDKDLVCRNILIDNNIIQHGGITFPPAVAIWVGNSSNNRISHNDISDFPYSGISVGWRWGYGVTQAHNNEIAYNKVHHLGWSVMADMGGIYTLGESFGTKVHHNVIHDIAGYKKGFGIYEDEGTTGAVFKNNLVFRVSDTGFMHHYGKKNVVKGNVFGCGLRGALAFGKPEKHLSFTFKNNLIYAEGNKLVVGSWEKARVKFMDNKIIHATKRPDLKFISKEMRSLNDISIEKAEISSIEGFIHWSQNKLAEFGWEVPDWKNAGVYGDSRWKDRATLSKVVMDNFEAAHISYRRNKPKMYSKSADFEKN